MNQISGRRAFLYNPQNEGVKYLFGNPGATELSIMDALVEYPEALRDTLREAIEGNSRPTLLDVVIHDGYSG